MKEALIGIYEQAIELMGKIPEEWIVGFCVALGVLTSVYLMARGAIGYYDEIDNADL